MAGEISCEVSEELCFAMSLTLFQHINVALLTFTFREILCYGVTASL